MTEVRAAIHKGFALIYDTDDVESINVSTPHDFVESEGPNGAVRLELTGFSSLDLHVDFKHGKRALWVKDEEVPTT
jgi:hypothetical protein